MIHRTVDAVGDRRADAIGTRGAAERPSPRLVATLLLGAALWPVSLRAAPPSWPGARQDTTRQDSTRSIQEAPQRDPIGDLNADAVRTGAFPGAILLPGTKVSLAIGGYIKTAIISDSRLEVSGADLLSTTIGTTRPDEDGNFSVDATLSKLYFDGRAPVSHGSVRGYIEWDFNAANNGSLGMRPRLIFGSWESRAGTLLVGHNWTTFMNVGVIPEGLTEATLSGAVFTRQAQVRWTQRISEPVSLDLALESSGAGDFLFQNESVARTRWPDLVGAAEWRAGGTARVRASGVIRKIADGTDTTLTPATGWGVSVSGYVRIGRRDRLALSGAYGKGIARYVLGHGAGASGSVDAGAFQLLRNHGAFVVYRRGWSERVRSSAAFGRAWTRTLDGQPDDAFHASTYAFVNLMWSPMPFLTCGAEYAYGLLERKDRSSHDNHRVALGVQIF